MGLAVAGLYIGGRLLARPRPHPGPLYVATVAHPAAPAPVAPKPSPMPSQAAVQAAPVQTPAPAAGKPVVAQAQPAAQPQQPVPPQAAATPAQASNGTAPQKSWNLVAPKDGEQYLQLAALGTEYTRAYVVSLETKGIHAVIAPGPAEGLYRVLVGPFAERAALERQQSELEAAGIRPMIRVYPIPAE